MDVPLNEYASYLPRRLVRRFARDATVPQTPQDQMTVATLMFADIAGFAALAERLAQRGPEGTEQLTGILNAYFGLMIAQVEQHGGDVFKFAGDALLAIWLPDADTDGEVKTDGVATDNEAERITAAVACSLAIQRELQDFTADGERLQLRITVDTGKVRLLEIGGVHGRWESLILGEPLHRVCAASSHAESGKVVVSTQAWSRVADRFNERQGAHQSELQLHEVSQLRDETVFTPRPWPAPELRADMEPGLRSFLPRAILERMAAGLTAWLDEMRTTTVLFAGLPMINVDTPLAVIQQVMEIVQRILYRYEGSINKLSVDEKGVSLLAAFGLPPLTHEDDPRRALLAAREMVRELTALTTSAGPPSLGGIGVTTGRISCGSMGSLQRREYTMMGETVNLAARLMQKADGGVLCDANTQTATLGNWQFEPARELSLKNIDGKILAYAPREENREAFVAERTASRRAMVGRTTECQHLLRWLDTVAAADAVAGADQDASNRSASADCDGLLIVGEAGIGKSRVIEWLGEQVRSRSWWFLQTGADAIEKNTPWHAWRGIVTALLQPTVQQESDSLVDRLLVLHPELQPLLPLLRPVWSEAPAETALTLAMDSASRADNIRRLLLRLLRVASQGTRLVIVLDDAQWLDSVSWAMLPRLRGRGRRVSVVLSLRPFDEDPPAEYQHFAANTADTKLVLGILTPAACRELICTRLGVEQVADVVVDWIVERSEGHPFFCEELTLSLRDNGLLSIQNNRCELACTPKTLADLTFPEALKGVITSRIDRLSPPQQMVTKTASIIGRHFEFDVLTRVYPMEHERQHIPGHLDELCARDLAQPVSGKSDPAEAAAVIAALYAFKHALIRDVAYNLMYHADRRKLHQSVAETYEQAPSATGFANYSRLAWHWEQAGDHVKTLENLELAGTSALRNGAYREAADFLQRALTVVNERELKIVPARAAGLERQLGVAQMGLGDLSASRDHYQSALARVGEPAPSGARRTFGLINQLSRFLVRGVWRRTNTQPPTENDPRLEAVRAYEQLAELHYLANETSGFLYASLRMLNLAERCGVTPELARARGIMGLTMATVPWHNAANRYFAEAQAAADLLQDKPSQTWIQYLTGIFRVGAGEWIAARELLSAARNNYEELGNRRQWGAVSTILGATYYFTGNFEKGAEIWSDVQQRASQRQDVLQEAWGYGGLAMNVLGMGRLDEAITLARAGVERFATNNDRISACNTRGVLAAALFRSGQVPAAVTEAVEVWRTLGELGRPTSYYTLEAYSAVVKIALAMQTDTENTGTPRDLPTSTSAIKALARYAKVFPIGRPRLLYWQAMSAAAKGRMSRALRFARQSLKVADEMQMHAEADRAVEQLLQWLPADAEERNELTARDPASS